MFLINKPCTSEKKCNTFLNKTELFFFSSATVVVEKQKTLCTFNARRNPVANVLVPKSK